MTRMTPIREGAMRTSGSARVPRVGFGVSPKHSSHIPIPVALLWRVPVETAQSAVATTTSV
jgi:hypothetical protein